MTDLTLPHLGETVTEGTIVRWFKRVGDWVELDEPLYEVSTDKADSEVPSPATGFLIEIVSTEGTVVQVGEILGRIGEKEIPAGDSPLTAGFQQPLESEVSFERIRGPELLEVPPARGSERPATRTPTREGADALVSPVVRRLVDDRGLDLSLISGSGRDGRITRRDVEQYLRDNPSTVEKISSIRRQIGKHMVLSKATSPHVLTAMEVDYEAVEVARQSHGTKWKMAEGFSLTYLPFIVRAVTEALVDFSRINASIGDGELLLHGDVNLAVAIDLDFKGLVAPVIRRIDQLSLTEVARAIAEVAERARSGKLTLDDMDGGTFTITNAGSYGTMFQFPIINQPQVAILSTDGISRKPAVVVSDDGIETITVRSIGILALAWDHRAFDGAYAAAFLDRIRLLIETTDWDAEC